MNDFFSSYKQAFDNFDAESIATHYKFPCQISDVDGLHMYATVKQLMDKCNYPLPSFLRRQESIADLHDVSQHYLRDYRLRGNDGGREQLRISF